jgi:DNA-directed RNA polymerase subunit K
MMTKMEEYTKYEHARIVGARALQISMGAPFMIKLNEDDLKRIGYNPVEIAKMEFKEGLIPINVRRPMPGTFKKETSAKPFDQTKLE